MTWQAKMMKMVRKAARGKLFDVAAAPVLLLSGGVLAVIGVVVLGLAALAVWLIVRAIRKNKAGGSMTDKKKQ